MTTSQNDGSLMRTLRRLYTSIMTRYMKDLAKSNSEHVAADVPQSIISPLSECIENLAAKAVRETGVAASSPSGVAGDFDVRDPAPLMPVSSPGMEAGKLAAFFKNTHRRSAVSLDTGDRLIQHTWEHIHSSIRFAHQGDVKSARLHVELANNAFKEASHYLSPPAYAQFAQDVTKALNEINTPPVLDNA